MKQAITMSKTASMTVDGAFELFIRKCKVKNLSENSINSYWQKTIIFKDFVGHETDISTITENTVDDYILYLRDNTKANEITVNSYLRSVRAFLYYCMECNYLERFVVHLTKVEKKIKETYTDDELERLLARPDIGKCSFTEFKTWVFENYLLATGNRLTSALNVRIQDINFNDGLITIRKTKNRRQQILPLSNTLSGILMEYLEIRGGTGEEYLFCNVYGEKGSARTFQQLVQNYNIKRNVNKTSCHLFRHTFAKQWILAGGDVFRLQKILGHSDLTVTKEYVAMFGNDLSMDFEKFNPLDNLKNKSNIIKM